MEATSNNWFTNKYPIGYALSGGFIKGFAHLGVMQSLLEHDIKPNILSGVSAGALAGVFYADGNEPHKVLDYFSGHKFQDLTKLVIPKVGLFELGEFIDFLKTNLKAKTMEELQIRSRHHMQPEPIDLQRSARAFVTKGADSREVCQRYHCQVCTGLLLFCKKEKSSHQRSDC